jgi:UDP-3-O-[3-hydroxymyristoyl] glucosamine N-acyltransferase
VTKVETGLDMTITAQSLITAIGDGFVALHGDPNAEARHVASLANLGAGALLFVKSADADLVSLADALGSGVIIASSPLGALPNVASGCAIIETVNPRLAFARSIAAHFAPSSIRVGVHPTAIIADDTIIDPAAAIGANVYIGSGCKIGAGCRIFPNVTILDRVTIGQNVTIYAGTVIGADGFGYEQNAAGGFEKFPHIGGVRIEDDVEIGANTCIDRGALDDTIIRRGARVDNLVHVAHNVEIGEDAMVIALTMLGGSVKIGARAWIAPSATIINQKSIGADATVGLAAVVTKDVAPGQVVMGSPAIDQAQFKAMNAAMKKLVS